MRSLLLVVGTLMAAVASLPAFGQIMRCTEGMLAIPDDRFLISIDQVKSHHRDIVFQTDDRPCQHANATLAALAATLRRSRLDSLSGYEFVKIVRGDAHFTIERFNSANSKALQALAAAMDTDHSRKLKIKANTSYDYFLIDDGVVIMITSASGRAGNAEIFSQFRQFFVSLPKSRH